MIDAPRTTVLPHLSPPRQADADADTASSASEPASPDRGWPEHTGAPRSRKRGRAAAFGSPVHGPPKDLLPLLSPTGPSRPVDVAEAEATQATLRAEARGLALSALSRSHDDLAARYARANETLTQQNAGLRQTCAELGKENQRLKRAHRREREVWITKLCREVATSESLRERCQAAESAARRPQKGDPDGADVLSGEPADDAHEAQSDAQTAVPNFLLADEESLDAL